MFNKRKSEEPKPAGSDIPAEREAEPSKTDPPPAPQSFPPPSFKDASMARSPFAPPPTTPATPLTPPPPRAVIPTTSPREAAEHQRRTLVVGRGISVQGTVQDAERLVVEGTMEAGAINGLIELAISPGGMFKGEVEVDDAEIAGTVDGTVIARGTLIVRATGRVLGTARCRRLQVEDGGQITGRIEMLTGDGAPAPRAEN